MPSSKTILAVSVALANAARLANASYVLVDPMHPIMSEAQQCSYEEGLVGNTYNVVINNAKRYDTSTCGTGFLDNIHGRGCTVTSWGCNYAADGDTLNANFCTDSACGTDDIQDAINAAFGNLEGVVCSVSELTLFESISPSRGFLARGNR